MEEKPLRVVGFYTMSDQKTVRMRFTDGTSRDISFSSLLDKEPFSQLENKAVFLSMAMEGTGLAWRNADPPLKLDASFLAEHSKLVESES